MNLLLPFFFGIRNGYVKKPLLFGASSIFPSTVLESDDSSPVVDPLVLEPHISPLDGPAEACD